MRASLRSLRLREAGRAPANARARLRLRAEVRRNRVAQAGLVVSVGIGATRLRRPQSVTPPATDCGLAPALCPATAYRHRSGAVPPATAFRHRSGAAHPLRRRSDLAFEPRPALGTTTFALELRPLRGRFNLAPALCPRSGDHGLCPGAALRSRAPRSRGARCEKPSVLVAGGQNRRFFAVSEVRNGRFCRLFAYGLSGSANNRVFWP